MCTTSGWHQRKYGENSLYHRGDQWKKVHVALDLETSQVMAVSYSHSNRNDCEAIAPLCEQICEKVRLVVADGAYDTYAFYKIIAEKWQAQALDYLKQRDAVIKEIRESATFQEGLAQWKKDSGYHQRSRIEAFMNRLKRIFGFYWHSRTTSGRITR